MAETTAKKSTAKAPEPSKEQATDGGSRIVLPSGESYHVTARFTTVAKAFKDGEGRFFVKMDGTGRIFVGEEMAKNVVVEEVKG